MKPKVTTFFHEPTCTCSHIVAEPDGSRCAIIDSVLDYDPASGRTGTEAADRIVDFVGDNDLKVEWILETHAHADHPTAAPYLKEKLGGSVGIGAHVTVVQATFKKLFNLEPGLPTDGSQFDHLYQDEETIQIGGMRGQALHTPGHTPACMTYLIGDTAFVGDTIFMPDFGTARCDFPGGDARSLYRSIRKLLSLPPDTLLFMCHDYAPGGRSFAWETTVGEERNDNIHIRDGISEEEFVTMRAERDADLPLPQRIIPSVQINIRAGRFPPADENGVAYLRLPLNGF